MRRAPDISCRPNLLRSRLRKRRCDTACLCTSDRPRPAGSHFPGAHDFADNLGCAAAVFEALQVEVMQSLCCFQRDALDERHLLGEKCTRQFTGRRVQEFMPYPGTQFLAQPAPCHFVLLVDLSDHSAGRCLCPWLERFCVPPQQLRDARHQRSVVRREAANNVAYRPRYLSQAGAVQSFCPARLDRIPRLPFPVQGQGF